MQNIIFEEDKIYVDREGNKYVFIDIIGEYNEQ
jgi:predicted RNA-binding protein